jgi:sugar phosphate isomerase/epimerase
MPIPGLVSVTFRNKTPCEICGLCARAGLKSIEWGGDVHVPPDGGNAPEVARMCRDAGLEICAYGSYFRVGGSLDAFLKNLDAASALGAPAIRVWLGSKGSAEVAADGRASLLDGLAAICQKAGERGMIVAPEFHGGTLTDDISSVERLMDETREIENLRFYWQPRWDWPEAERLRALETVRPRLLHVHAFTWRHADGIERLSLADGETMWKKALARLADTRVLLEFVRDDGEEELLRDARALTGWIG